MSAVCEITPPLFGKRSTRLLPPSATQRLPAASRRTPDPVPAPLGSQKHKEDAVGPGMLSQSAARLQPLPVKLACPHTASATVSVLNGVLYFSTRLLSASGTQRL